MCNDIDDVVVITPEQQFEYEAFQVHVSDKRLKIRYNGNKILTIAAEDVCDLFTILQKVKNVLMVHGVI